MGAAFENLAVIVSSGQTLVRLEHFADRDLEMRAGDAARDFAFIGTVDPGIAEHVRGREFAAFG